MEKLAFTPRNCWEVYESASDKKAMEALAVRYIDFLSRCKTERETVAYVQERLAKAGYAEGKGKDKLMVTLHGKTLFVAGEKGPGMKFPLFDGENSVSSVEYQAHHSCRQGADYGW